MEPGKYKVVCPYCGSDNVSVSIDTIVRKLSFTVDDTQKDWKDPKFDELLDFSGFAPGHCLDCGKYKGALWKNEVWFKRLKEES